ncbi:MAG: S8 family serine peptidase [Bdellovibrionota bacterium]
MVFKRHLTALLTLLASVTLCFVSAASAENHPEAIPGQYIIKFSSSVRSASARARVRDALGVKIVQSHELTGAQLVETAPGNTLDDSYAKNLLAAGTVAYIEPNYRVSIDGAPNDSRFNELWGMNNTGQTGGTSNIDIDAPEAWNINSGNGQVVVGVVDTGVDFNHPDLAANIWHNPGEIPGNGIDDDGNGVVDDVYGYNAINPSAAPLDDNGHGTHCSGTIGGAGNNSRGVAGVNWNVKIMGLKFLDSTGSGSTNDAVSAIEYAIRMKQRGVNLKVLSNSWGGGGQSQALEDAIAAANNAGILFVAAAGNSASDNDVVPSYPASYSQPNVLSVAAIDQNGNLASFSNYGATSVDLAAPGVNILSTTPNNTYSAYSGTSMATPHVSGVAALLAANEPTLTVTQLRARLIGTVKPLTTLSGQMVAPGIVDAYNALTNTQTPLPPSTPSASYKKSAGVAAYDANLGERVLTTDDGYISRDLGFTFPYYDSRYTRISISANGRVIPLAPTDADPATPDYANRLAPGIDVLNDDLYPSSAADGGVWFKTGASGATITWVSVPYPLRNNGQPESELRFQLKLYSNGRIEFHYLDTFTGDPTFDYGKTATVGIAPIGTGEKLIISNNTANQAELGNGKLLRFDQASRHVRADFDGDGVSDIIVWRPTTGWWYVLTSASGFDYAAHQGYQLGLPGDRPLVGDFDGDGRADLAVWRPTTGMWYFRSSGSGYQLISSLQWGLPGDQPISADYDGDGLADIAVYRPGVGYFVLRSSTGFNRSAALLGSQQSLMSVAFPGAGNDPVVGDFNGDGADDFATVWQLVRFWTTKDSSGQVVSSLPWGQPGDTPFGCDWDGNGKADRVVVRPSAESGLQWFTASDAGPVYTLSFGQFGDIPSCSEDYDGDHQSDVRVFRPTTGEWLIRSAGDGSVKTYSFGLPGDLPL